MILGIIILALIVLAIIGCLACFYVCFYAPNKVAPNPYGPVHGEQAEELKEQIYANTSRMEEVEFESVTIQSFDGLKLFGRYYHQKDGAPVQILFHGYRSMALRDCAGGFLMARKLGFNVLVVDQRAHGNSEGHVITLGIFERRDCLSWIRYINERFGKETPIVLSGTSMGAATVIMATALPMPDNVLCVLADSPYTSPAEILKQYCKNRMIPTWIVYPLIRIAARYIGGFKLEQTSAIEAVGVSPIPILVLHGDEDRIVPCTMGAKIHDLSNDCTRLKLFMGADHCLSYLLEPKLYEMTVLGFLKQFPALEAFIASVEV